MIECTWPLDVTECCPPGDEYGTDPDLLERVILQTSAMMSRLSGYMIGLCTATIRPLDNCAECRHTCCGGVDGIMLSGPNGFWIDQVVQVTFGDDIINPATYRFDRDQQMLWRIPGLSWPTRDTRWIECGDDDAFCVDVLVGSEPDAWALAVANSLACELLKSCTGQKCRIPRNATQVTGQGVTVTLSDQEISTLLPEVSGWVKVVNRYNVSAPARVFSPDINPMKMKTGHGGGSTTSGPVTLDIDGGGP